MDIFDKTEQEGLEKAGQAAGAQYDDPAGQGVNAPQRYVGRPADDPSLEDYEDQDAYEDEDEDDDEAEDEDDYAGLSQGGQRGGYDDQGQVY
jgi:hypothetical protein